jgi:2',3'-cyclic-nucleotide 2'-phosphodiesterase / 3'-nucleotidase / 5'-nucleotidase
MKLRRKSLVLLAVTLIVMMLASTVATAVTYHTVLPGEWLSTIAPKYGTTWQMLYDANKDKLTNPNLIFPGQQLVVPDKGTTPPAATKDAFTLTILGTSDVHANLTGWSYESGKDSGKDGFARLATLADSARQKNPYTLLVDNGDTLQGTLLADDLYNSDLTKPNPVITVMNTMKYDAMVLGNHEFNFGLDLIAKAKKEASFPLLSANIYNKADGKRFATPYLIKTLNGAKVGIFAVSVPTIEVWDGPKVTSLEFKHMADEARLIADVLLKTEKVDVLIGMAHSGLDTRHETDGGDAARLIAEKVPEMSLLITGHDHMTVNEVVNGVQVVAPKNNGLEMIQADLAMKKVAGKWTVSSKVVKMLSADGVVPSAKVIAAAKPFHDTTITFLANVIGKATGDFHPASEVPGIPEAMVRDTAVIDLINKVQLEATGADVAGAALFSDTSNIKAGNISYSSIFDIYKYPNTLVTVEVTGKELKAYMEWSASYYNTWKPGDVTISFDPSIRGYNYDMFAGVNYMIDISQPAGKRIANVTFGGKAITDDQVLTLAINNYRYSGLKAAGIISGEPVFNSDPKSLRAYIKDYIEKTGTIEPVVDNNWSIIGANLSHPLRTTIIDMVKAGTLTIPKSADGRTPNAKALNVYELMADGTLSGYKEINIFHTNDTHGRVKAGDGMGFAKISTLVSTYKAINPNALLLDIGDTFHGVNFATLSKGASVVRVMNTMKYDAMAPGNHDFNYGQARLTELDTLADFPVLAANVKKADGTYYLTPYVIKTIDGVKVALFGLATPETLYKTNPLNVAGLTFEDPIVSAKAIVAELAGKADVIVAMAHLGIEGDDTSRALAAAVPQIDVILDGHSHSIVNEVVNGVLIAQTGYYDKGLGITTLIMKDGALNKKGTALYTMNDAKNVTEDAAVKAIVTEVDAEVTALTAVVIGTSPVLLDGERPSVRTKPTNLANLITAAILDKTGADVAITNGGGIRASIKAGTVTKGDVLTVLPFGNYVVVKELKGSDILAALELGFSIYPEALGGYAQTAGLTIKFDSSKVKGSRIVEVKVAGVLLDPAKTYKVATNDFMAVGGDNYTMLKNGPTVGEYPALDEIVIEYIQNKGFGAAVDDTRVTDVAPAATGLVELLPAA